jgi:hypothetical protein
MHINRTMESISYRDMFHTGLEKSPKFLRRISPEGTAGESDIVEISEDARKRLMEKNSSPLAKSVMQVSRDIAELILSEELKADAGRRERIDDVRDRVRRGTYDFDSSDRLERAGGAVTAQLSGMDR